MTTDADRIAWLEAACRKSPSGISFDWVPSIEGEPSGFRFMRRFFIGNARKSLRAAIDSAIRDEPTFRKDAARAALQKAGVA